jgi:hypothetical protein
MRKLLMFSLLALLTASATGCMSSNPCGGGWHPGALFGRHPNECCCESQMAHPVYSQGGGGCCQ